MKRTLFLTMALLGSAMAQAAETNPSYTLGNVMYVGDSITNGHGAASYRWAMHKILVDNGISYNEVGIEDGNRNFTLSNTMYGGVNFENKHCSQSSARAYHIAGVDGNRNNAEFFGGGSNIKNWLDPDVNTFINFDTGQSIDYKDEKFTGEKTPDTFFLLIGTNDTLSEYNNFGASAQNLQTELSQLLGYDQSGKTFSGNGYMDTIVGTMKESNAESEIIVMGIPTWIAGRGNNNQQADFDAIKAYNTVLKDWCGNNEVKYIDVNTGIDDVAYINRPEIINTNKPGQIEGSGVPDMFLSDGLHPSAQGDLIIAGNLAKAMGYAGRTAGQQRVAAGDGEGWTTLTADNAASTGAVSLNNVTTTGGKLDFSAEGTSSVSIAWENVGKLNNGFTVELSDWCVGNGYTDSIWNTTDNLSIVLGNDSFYGTLNINEAYIQWGSEILYSYDMSTLGTTDNLRIAYLSGSAAEGVNQGFYVWLGDMLIGEGKGRTEGSRHNGVTLTYSGTGNVTIGSLSVNAEASYAPTTSGTTNESDAFIAQIAIPAPPAEPQGTVTLPTTFTKEQTVTSTVDQNGTKTTDFTAGITTNANDTVHINADFTNLNLVYANSSSRTVKDLYVTVAKGTIQGWSGAHGGNTGALTGNVTMLFTDDFAGGSTAFGAVNAGDVTGNITLVFDAAEAAYNSFAKNNSSEFAAVVGSYATNIYGTFKAVINNGTFNYDILAGVHTAKKVNNVVQDTYIGSTEVYVNGGHIKKNIYGGSRVANGIIGNAQARSATPATLVTVTNGVIDGNVYGGGQAGTINGDTQVNITGGTIKGSVYGGGTGGTINGNTYVTIDGNLAAFKGTTIISAGGTGGTITGDSTLTIKNAASSDYECSIDKFKGTLSGGANVTGTRTLAFDKAKLSGTSFDLATLENFDIITLSGGSNVSLSSLGGATELSLTSSTLRVTGDSSKLWSITMDIDSALTLTNLDGTETQNIFINVTGSNVDLSKLNLTVSESELAHQAVLDYVYLRANGKIYEVAVDWRDQQGAVRNLVAGKLIPEPATATLSLLALAALAARRRRR